MTLLDYFVSNTDLRREWDSDKNELLPDAMSPYARTKVWWRCEKGHEWLASPNSRISMGRGCPYCVNQAVVSGENDIVTVAPHMAKLWHPTKNGELTPSEVTPGSSKLLWWQCERGHEWQARAYSLKAGCACPYCSGRRPIAGETDLATVHPHVEPTERTVSGGGDCGLPSKGLVAL